MWIVGVLGGGGLFRVEQFEDGFQQKDIFRVLQGIQAERELKF